MGEIIKRRKKIMKTKKTSYTFKLDSELFDNLKKEAVKENRSFNNHIETILKKNQPK